MRILANDGISNAGKSKLESHGFEVVTDKVDQENLAQGINEGNFVGVLVRAPQRFAKIILTNVQTLSSSVGVE